MKVLIQSVLDGKKASLPFSLREEWSDMPGRDVDLQFSDPVAVDGVVQFESEDRLQVSGSIVVTLAGTCDRCLEETRTMMVVPFEETFARSNGGQVGAFDEEADAYLFNGESLDLTTMVQDYLLLNLPSLVLCEPECKGLCPVCGINRNLTQCSCRVITEEEANQPSTQRPFAEALAALASDDEEV